MHFILDVHCHTTATGHAYSTLKENLAQAKKIGLALTGASDHGPDMLDSCRLSHFENILKLPEVIDGMPWLKGVEANIINTSGGVDIPGDILAQLDFCIASIHESVFYPGSTEANTAAIIDAMENPNVHIIGHLGDTNIPINTKSIITAAKKTGTIIEINNKSLTPGTKRFNGGGTIREILALCKKHGVAVIAGSDAHMAKDVGRLDYAGSYIMESGIDKQLVMNTNIERFIDTLKGKRNHGKKS